MLGWCVPGGARIVFDLLQEANKPGKLGEWEKKIKNQKGKTPIPFCTLVALVLARFPLRTTPKMQCHLHLMQI